MEIVPGREGGLEGEDTRYLCPPRLLSSSPSSTVFILSDAILCYVDMWFRNIHQHVNKHHQRQFVKPFSKLFSSTTPRSVQSAHKLLPRNNSMKKISVKHGL
jgi:hypothetical protein